MKRLENKVALVTGAANGIGLATAKVFTDEGAKVVMADLDEQKGTAEAVKINAKFMKLDVSNENNWKDIFSQLMDEYGQIDIVANIAGIPHNDNIENITSEDWHKVLGIDLDGVLYGTKYGVLNMKNGGSIINFSSDAGLVGTPGNLAYSAAKGGVILLTKSAALYCAQKKNGIRINAVAPGVTNTDLISKGSAGGVDFWAQFEPVGRLADPEEIAKAVLFLASDDSSYATGSTLVVDGGYSAQ
ncbi:MAG TPA: SDR family oxidoreductase [Candidatus Limosilactobacillus intestinigallinarum]|nr:SDR family oxidoreductase [Candidatus Limosilactobacillus intestinigallinarum]